MEGAFLLLDEEHRGSDWRLQQADSSVCQILSEELIKFLLFSRGEGECPPSREFGVRVELYGVVPCFARGEVGEGLFGEDICKVLVVLWDSASRWVGSLGLSLL